MNKAKRQIVKVFDISRYELEKQINQVLQITENVEKSEGSYQFVKQFYTVDKIIQLATNVLVVFNIEGEEY